jgi:hypothetical protein
MQITRKLIVMTLSTGNRLARGGGRWRCEIG